VPRGAVLERGDEPLAGLGYPVIVKPTREDGSHGIRSASLAATEAGSKVLRFSSSFQRPKTVLFKPPVC
jgi:biotin carboxylase